jgi:hypothetical protein
MAYGFSLRDDDEDELDAPLLEDPTYRAMSLSSQPTGVAAPRSSATGIEPASYDAAPWKPNVAPRDPALQKKWQDTESVMLGRAAYDPSDYGLGEFARDNAGVLIASLASVLSGDKGQSLPSLAAAAEETNRYYETQRRADAKNAGDFALRARAQKSSDLADQLNIKRLQNQDRQLAQQDQRIELAGKGEDRRTGEYSRKYDPTNPQVIALKDAIVEASGGRVKRENLDALDSGGLQQMAHAYNLQYDSANTGQKARDEAIIAGATSSASANARNRSDVAYAPALGAARGVGEARGEAITRPEKVATAGAVRAATEDAADAAGQAGKSEKFQTDFAEKNDALLKSRAALARIAARTGEGSTPEGFDVKSRALDAIPGGGNLISDVASLNLQDVDVAATQMLRNDSGASAAVQEQARNVKQTIGTPGLSAEKKWLAVKNFQAALDADIRGKASRPGDVQQVIERYGISNLDVTEASAPRTSSNARALPVPGSVRVGKPDRGAAGGVQSYTFKAPGGSTFSRPMTAEQVQTFVNANPDWQVY